MDGKIMSLNINSPAYYSQIHGIDNDIYRFQLLITRNIDVKNYSEIVDAIGIVPIIAPSHIQWNEEKQFHVKHRFVCIKLRADYEKYLSADFEGKKQILLQNIFDSLYVVRKRLGRRFDYDRIVNDIKELVSNC